MKEKKFRIKPTVFSRLKKYIKEYYRVFLFLAFIICVIIPTFFLIGYLYKYGPQQEFVQQYEPGNYEICHKTEMNDTYEVHIYGSSSETYPTGIARILNFTYEINEKGGDVYVSEIDTYYETRYIGNTTYQTLKNKNAEKSIGESITGVIAINISLNFHFGSSVRIRIVKLRWK